MFPPPVRWPVPAAVSVSDITLSEGCLASSDNCPSFAAFDIEAAVP
jgi:hypothetical protein